WRGSQSTHVAVREQLRMVVFFHTDGDARDQTQAPVRETERQTLCKQPTTEQHLLLFSV
ncbi:mCG145820, partial [Mus musculus]